MPRIAMIRKWWLALLGVSLLIISCSKEGAGIVDDDGDSDDKTPPMTIVDLEIASFGTEYVVLEWTAPGDDSVTGFAFEYDLRGSLDSVTAGNFQEAYRIDSIDAPLPPGTTQSCQIDSLTSGETYYFAIKTRDDNGNWSGISNCVSITCLVDQVIVFPDEALDSLVRATVGMQTGDIHLSDVEGMDELMAEDVGISDLSGLESCTDLKRVILPGSNISDLTPLASLPQLLTLNLINNNVTSISQLSQMGTVIQLHLGENPISDISSLSNMTQLEWLRLNSTKVTDFSPIYSLPSLKELDLSGNALGDNIGFVTNFSQIKKLALNANSIANIDALSSMTNVENLQLVFNNLSDITALQGLTNLTELYLDYNQIADISPLVNNSGLGSGDVVYLQNNPLSVPSTDSYISTLQARGVTVYY
ncbi:hypothetical protein GF356_06165 [candidate division GN15 bacterium]|nr:hypothetical protein [candidate division GN15 bacterium]